MSEMSCEYMRSRTMLTTNAMPPMSRPMTVTEKAVTRLSESAAMSPLARPTSAGDSGMRVPMRPSMGPMRTRMRVRSRRLIV